MRKKHIAGNWKMNGSEASVTALADALAKASLPPNIDITVFPAAVHLKTAREILKNSPVRVGAQNCYIKDSGAFTGEISPLMLRDLGCTAVLAGHSERRQLFHEDPEFVAQKVEAALKAGITPFLCVGETRTEREAGQTEHVILEQLNPVLKKISINALKNCIIAYEPVWAIGTGLTATPDEAQAVHAFIRNHLSKSDANIARNVQILYGGSVKAANAAELFAMPDVDGALVGGASLQVEEFLAICAATG